jgi:RNA-directed DNA polymerase
MRPLGIPNLRDRVVQAAVLLILEPIFESDFLDCSHGFRPGRSAHDALEIIRGNLSKGRCTVYDADMEGYFDSIPHDKLMACVRMRVVDGSVLRLIKQWLNAAVEEKDGNGKITRKRNRQGTPQGGVISPLLANIYLHWFDKAFHAKDGPAHWAKAVLGRYADDFVVLCHHGAVEVLAQIRRWVAQMGLMLNEQKTRVVDGRTEPFTFLGYTFGPMHYRKDGHWYLGAAPAKKAVQRIKGRIRQLLRPTTAPWPKVVAELNAVVRGWAGYFAYGTRWLAYRAVDRYVYDAVRHCLRRRHKVLSRGTRRFSRTRVFGELGVFSLRGLRLAPPAHARV